MLTQNLRSCNSFSNQYHALPKQALTLLASRRIKFPSRVRIALKPFTEDVSPDVATSRVPNFVWSQQIGDFEWKDPTFRMPGYRKGDPVRGLTKEEIEYEKFLANSVDQTTLESASPEQNYTDENEEDVFTARYSNDLSLPCRPYAAEIDDGIIEADWDDDIGSHNENLTRIEVRYLFGTSKPERVILGKRAREEEDEDSDHRRK